MPNRINHLAVWVAAIAYYLWGALWFVVLGNVWTTQMKAVNPAWAPMPSPIVFVSSFLLGLVLAYATAMALTRRAEDQTIQQGISFALFMGIALYATQTLNQYLYAHWPLGLWLVMTAYVVIGFAIIGAIVGGWKKKTPA